MIDKKSQEAAPHVALKVDQKGKKPANQSYNNDAKKRNLACYYCKKKGHFKANCWKFKADHGTNDSTDTKKAKESKDKTAKLAADNKETVINLFMAWEGTSDLAENWIIDSGATSPMTARKDWIINYMLFERSIPVSLGDDRTIEAIGLGSVRISMNVNGSSNVYKFRNVYYVPEIGSNNLLSVTYMVNKGYFVGFGAHKCEISKGGMVIGEAEKRRNLWILQGVTISPVAELAHIAKVSLELWHKHLGHAMMRSVEKLSHESMVTRTTSYLRSWMSKTHGDCIEYSWTYADLLT